MTWTQIALLSLASFVLTVLITKPLIGFLSDRQIGKTIREDGPAHQAKAGTPTMGGIGMLVAIALVGLVVTVLTARQPYEGIPFLGMAVFAGLGALDDWQGLARKGRAREMGVGLTARHMLILQIVAALALLLLSFSPSVSGMTRSEYQNTSPIDWMLLLGVWTLAIVATVNGVNFADGLDGLCAGLLALAFIGLGVASLATGSGAAPQSFVAASACLGFLVFNRHPARVFMGNVASMGLGALLALLALRGDAWWLLPIIGAVFVAEVLSDVIQIGYFKLTGGKRFFRMAPIHHHFEQIGWPETKIVRVFWSFGLIAALAGVGLAAWIARS